MRSSSEVVVEDLVDLVKLALDVATREGDDSAGRRVGPGLRVGRAKLLGGLNTRSRIPPSLSFPILAAEDAAVRPARPAGFRQPRDAPLLGELTDDEQAELVFEDSTVRGDSAALSHVAILSDGGELALRRLTLESFSRLFTDWVLTPVNLDPSLMDVFVLGTDCERGCGAFQPLSRRLSASSSSLSDFAGRRSRGVRGEMLEGREVGRAGRCPRRRPGLELDGLSPAKSGCWRASA